MVCVFGRFLAFFKCAFVYFLFLNFSSLAALCAPLATDPENIVPTTTLPSCTPSDGNDYTGRCKSGSAGNLTQVSNSGCACCPNGQVWDQTQTTCICPAGEQQTSTGCITCPTGQVVVADQCQCPGTTQWNGTSCITCPGNQRIPQGGTTCPTRYCGNKVVEAGEQCDDGNFASGDGCTASCVSEMDSCRRTFGNPNFGKPNCCDGVPRPAEYVIPWPGNNVYNICIQGHYVTSHLYDVPWSKSIGILKNVRTGEVSSRPFSERLNVFYNAYRVGRPGLPYVPYDPNQIYPYYTVIDGYAGWKTLSYAYDNLGEVCWTCSYMRVGGCFVPETRIQMADGSYKLLKNINSGDLVYNPLRNKSARVKSLLQSTESVPIVHIEAEGGIALRVTQKHPMLTKRGLLPANKIVVSDLIQIGMGEYAKVTVAKELPIDPNQTVMNLTLEADEDYGNHMVNAEGAITGDLYVQNKLATREKR